VVTIPERRGWFFNKILVIPERTPPEVLNKKKILALPGAECKATPRTAIDKPLALCSPRCCFAFSPWKCEYFFLK